jgi:spermidine/putrescine transport system permease protein
MSGLRRDLLRALARRPLLGAWSLLAPGAGWLAVFFAAPVLLMFAYSLMPRGVYGGVEPGFTLEHYRRFFEPLYLRILWRTVAWSALATIACLFLGYPVAWVIARSRRFRGLLLFLVVLPFWTSFLVRTFAMIFLLRDSGLVNTLLLRTGLIQSPLTLLYTPFAVLAGLVYGLLPFMVLPVYASLEKLDRSLLEAGADLGAGEVSTFFRVTVPLTMPGIVAGIVLVFIPSLGAFITPDLLGGAKSVMIGNLIQNQFTQLNQPFGSALSLILTAAVLLLLAVALKAGLKASELA